MKKLGTIFLILLAMWGLTYMGLQVQSADAAGFGIYEWDNRANGMGGAAIATQNPNASAIAYNPATMTQIEGTMAQAGVTFIAPFADVKLSARSALAPSGDLDVSAKGKVYTVPNVYGTLQIDDNWWVGIGEFSRFGLGTNYDHDWAGSANVYKASLESTSIAPTVAYKVNDMVSFAAGIEFIHGKMDLRQEVRSIAGTATTEELKLFPEGDAYSWNVSAFWNPIDELAFGAVYRHGFKFVGKGEAEYTSVGVLGQGGDANGSSHMEANFPSSVSLGINYTPIENLSIELDVIGTFWSQFKTMEYYFEDSADAGMRAINSNNSTSHKKYNDAVRVQLGLEYEALEDVFLRAGYINDRSPQNPEYTDYMLPSSDRQLVSAGLGLAFGDLALDFSAMRLWAADRSFNNAVAGTGPTEITNAGAWIGGFNVSYKF